MAGPRLSDRLAVRAFPESAIVSVGRSDGVHADNNTTLDGAGRARPHLVAPAPNTSLATARVSSAAAFLLSAIDGDPSALGDADDPRVIKAILLSGATKEGFMDWSATETSPLDSGRYAIEVSSLYAGDTIYGLAWQASPIPEPAHAAALFGLLMLSWLIWRRRAPASSEQEKGRTE